jgi:hypothetical protein
MTNKQTNNSKYLVSKAISYVCEAPFLAIPTFLILCLLLEKNNFLEIAIICLFFGTIIPILVLFIWTKLKKIDRDFTIKEDRNRPLLMAAIIYFIGALILWLFQANPLITAIMLCYGTNTIIVFIINLKWKISVHAMGITGPTTALMFANPWFFIFGLIGPLVMWSRLTLKKHTVGQLLAGSFFGYMLTAIQLYYLTKLMGFNINVDMLLIFLIIIGLTLPPLLLALGNYLKSKGIIDGYRRLIFYLLSFGLFIIFLAILPIIPTIALTFSGIISITIVYFEKLVFNKNKSI